MSKAALGHIQGCELCLAMDFIQCYLKGVKNVARQSKACRRIFAPQRAVLAIINATSGAVLWLAHTYAGNLGLVENFQGPVLTFFNVGF